MNVLSLFDGISCGQIALERTSIQVENYFASEIDKHAIKVTQTNYPNTIQLGDVKTVKYENGILSSENGQWEVDIDLLIGGSPCQGFSFAGKQLNFDDPRSALFFEYVRLKNEVKPKYFLLENVRMKKEYQDVISQYLGVNPVMINSSLVSAQNRVRLYWCNWNVEQPKNKNLTLRNIVENTFEQSDELVNNEILFYKQNIDLTINGFENYKALKSKMRLIKNMKTLSEKANTLTAVSTGNPAGNGGTNIMRKNKTWIKHSVLHCEHLQTLPDNYTEGISDTQRYKCIGNGWTVDVIVELFKSMLKNGVNDDKYLYQRMMF